MTLLKRIFWRSVYYLRVGATILSFPFTLLTFLTVIYGNITFLQEVFGGFTEFVLITGGVATILIGFFGYFWLKKSKFYKAEIEVAVEANQYQTKKFTPVSIPLTEALVALLEKEGIDCSKVKEIIARSKS